MNHLRKKLKTIVEEVGIKDDILSRSPRVTNTLFKLLASNPKDLKRSMDEITEIIKDIRVISYKPSTFRIVLQSDNHFDLIYSPGKDVDNFSDQESFKLFKVQIKGKKYNLYSNSDLDQAMDYINRNLSSKNIGDQGAESEESGGDEEEIPEPELDDKDEKDEK